MSADDFICGSCYRREHDCDGYREPAWVAERQARARHKCDCSCRRGGGQRGSEAGCYS